MIAEERAILQRLELLAIAQVQFYAGEIRKLERAERRHLMRLDRYANERARDRTGRGRRARARGRQR